MSDPVHDPIITVEPDTDETTKPPLLPPHHVILENDAYHSIEFVVMVLCRALGCSVERSFQFTLEAHNSGRAVVWTGSKEVAELKCDQITTFHEERDDGRKLGPLTCYIEPAA